MFFHALTFTRSQGRCLNTRLLGRVFKTLSQGPGKLSLFPNSLNKFNNTGALMLDSVYHMTTFKLCFCMKKAKILPYIGNVNRDIIT